MTLRLYNTLERRKVEFVPRDSGSVTVYVCGPTVYNHIHIGNARTFLTFDVVRRYLAHKGYGVTFVRNITDVDDKIIERSNEEGVAAEEVASKYTEAFREVMDALDIGVPDHEPTATETIPEMIEMVERLIEKDHAYESEGDVYFSVRSFPGYGKLSGRDVDDLRSGARVEVGERKRDPLDFALWKAAKPGEPHWTSPWGEGRPGWHLECSVMSTSRLGESFDIHGGGGDLVFPHHENEIAQSEADTGVPFARYWLHGGMLQINEEKMSKSLGNFTLAKDVLERYETPVIRLLMLQTHYRSPLDFSDDRLDEAGRAYDRLRGAVRDARETVSTRGRPLTEPGASDGDREAFEAAITDTVARFEAEMDDDFNTAGALGAVFHLVTRLNAFNQDYGAGPDDENGELLGKGADTVERLLRVLGIELVAETAAELPGEVVGLAREVAGYGGDDTDAAMDALLARRTEAREAKDWAVADAIRDGLSAFGVTIEDTPQGPRAVVSREAPAAT